VETGVPVENQPPATGHKHFEQYSSYIVTTSIMILYWWWKQVYQEKITDRLQVTNTFNNITIYCDRQLYRLRKPEYKEKTTNLLQVTNTFNNITVIP